MFSFLHGPRATRARLALAIALASCAAPRLLPAQTDYTHTIAHVGNVDVVSHHPNCQPFVMASDQISWSPGVSIRAPRLVLHAGWALMNTGIDETLKAIHAPAIVRHIVVRYGLPLTPHLIQAARGIHAGHYELNVWDWLYDFDAKQPLDVSASELRLRVVLAAPLFCFARP